MICTMTDLLPVREIRVVDLQVDAAK